RPAGRGRPAGGVQARPVLAVHGHPARGPARRKPLAVRLAALEGLGLTQAADGSFWRDRPTLVTGATGLVGGALVNRLLAHQADLVCLVRDWVPQSELSRSGQVEKVKVVRGD